MSDEKLSSEKSLEIWKKVIDVQMHFNDLCLRVRTVAVSILGVLIGSSAIAFRFGGHISIGNFALHTSAVFLFISIIIWLAFFIMDRYWYHELLRGAVLHGRNIEEKLKEAYPEIMLSNTIRELSHQSLNINAAKKLNYFYGVISIVQFLGFFLIAIGLVEMKN